MKKLILSIAVTTGLSLAITACNSTKNMSGTSDSTKIDTTMSVPVDTAKTDTMRTMPPDTTKMPPAQ